MKANIGKEFDLTVQLVEARTRTWVALTIVVFSAKCLLGAAVVGLYEGSFDKLQYVWGAAGPMLGGVMGHYFGSRTATTEKTNDETS
jgi:hypothetical protein